MKMLHLLLAGKRFRSKNTTVESIQGASNMFLFNNLIAVKEGGEIRISNAGWPTNTTRNRLNAILSSAWISKKGGRLFLNATPMKNFEWYNVSHLIY